MIELVLFSLSMLICGFILYLLGRLWFADTRNRKLQSLFILGMTVFFWTFFNAVSMLVQAQYYPFVYTLRMVMVCAIPYSLLWFFLHLTSSRFARSRRVFITLLSIAAADILVLLTNPLHRQYFTDYVYPRSPTGPLFWVHTAAAYATVLFAFIILIRHIIRYAKSQPLLLLAGIGTALPYVLNILFTFQAPGFDYDLTPFGFFITVLIFTLLSYRSRLLHISTTAFAGIFAALKDIILIVDKGNVIVDANNATGAYFPEFALEAGKTTLDELMDYLAPRIEACSAEGLPNDILHLSAKDRLEGELRLRTASGSRTFTPSLQYVGAGHRVTGYVLTFSDITEYRNMISEMAALKEQAESASEAKGSFLANMSHEMRTPMNAIIGMTAIAKSTESSAKKDECIEKVEEASVHLLGVINDILDMSKIEANKLELIEAEFDFEKMLMHATNVIHYSVNQKNIRFEIRTATNLPRYLVGDEQRIAQVITNLLSNAVKFTPEGGSVMFRVDQISGDRERCTIRIEVEDTGIGIDEEQQKRLFSSFQQADAGISRKYGGTGLGLAISRRIVEMAGGEMYLRSRPGEGSVFGFTLAMRRGERKPGAAFPPDVNWDSLRVLVVDDMAELRDYFMELSEAYGFSCITAASGEEARGIMEQDAGICHIVFIDWNLPGMSGIDLARWIRDRGQEDTVIVMISSADWSDIEKDATAAGIDRFIAKPLFTSAIVDAINSCISAEQRGGGEPVDPVREGMFSGYRVLLAEDIEINQEIVMALLEPTGLAIDTARDGNEVRDLFAASPQAYDAIFMDIHMPEKDGYEATREIRALDCAQAGAIPIIAMTANVFREDIERCLACGMNDHVGKPINVEEVVARLSKYLSPHA